MEETREFIEIIKRGDAKIVRDGLLQIIDDVKVFALNKLISEFEFTQYTIAYKYIAQRKWKQLSIFYILTNKKKNNLHLNENFNRLYVLSDVYGKVNYEHENYLSNISNMDFQQFQRNNNLRLFMGLLQIGSKLDIEINKMENYFYLLKK